MDEAEIAVCGLVVSGGEASRAFQLVDGAFDPVSHGIDEIVDRDERLSVLSARNDGRCASPFEIGANVVAVIAPVGQQNFRSGGFGLHDEVIAFVVRHFAAGDLHGKGQA